MYMTFRKLRMKNHIRIVTLLAGIACCSITHAGITGASWNSGGSAIQCTYLYPFANNTLDMDGIQHAAPALMNGTIDTDTPADPTLTLSSAVNNDTAFAWVGYQVNVYMTVPFTFTTPGPSVNNPLPNDWFVSGVVAPAFNGSQYEGTLYFSAGTPVGINGELDFLYSIHFGSSTHYEFSQEMIPSSVPVPEPSSLAFLAIGGLTLVLRRKLRAS
jgi:hypothetical protein